VEEYLSTSAVISLELGLILGLRIPMVNSGGEGEPEEGGVEQPGGRRGRPSLLLLLNGVESTRSKLILFDFDRATYSCDGGKKFRITVKFTVECIVADFFFEI